MLDDTDKALIEFVVGNREPVALDEIGVELSKLNAAGAQWPKASPQEWKRRILGLVSTGKLINNDGMVWVPKEEAQPKQLSLFD